VSFRTLQNGISHTLQSAKADFVTLLARGFSRQGMSDFVILPARDFNRQGKQTIFANLY